MTKSLAVPAALALTVLLAATPVAASPDAVNADFDSANFEEPLEIDNAYYPLPPGHQLILEGEEVAEGEALAKRLVVSASSVAKQLLGAQALAVSERDFIETDVDGVASFLLEDELTFVAQDDDDTVWRMAEYPEEYDPEAPLDPFAGAPNTWVAGVDDALPGLYMRGTPTAGFGPYSLVFSPNTDDFGIDDQGTVIETGLNVCVPAGCFTDVIKVVEQNVLQAGDCCQLKYHAPGIGNIKVEPGDALGNPTGGDGEYLELVDVRQLSCTELETLNTELLDLDGRAFLTEESQPLWQATAPAARADLAGPCSPRYGDDDPGYGDGDPGYGDGDPGYGDDVFADDDAIDTDTEVAGVSSSSDDPTPATTAAAGPEPKVPPAETAAAPAAGSAQAPLTLDELPRTGSGIATSTWAGLLLVSLGRSAIMAARRCRA